MCYFLAVVMVGPLPSWLIGKGIRPSWVALMGAAVSAISLSGLLYWPGIWTMFIAVLGTGIGGGMIRDTQVTITMNIVERDPGISSSSELLGSLRTIERLSSVLGLVFLAFLASVAGYDISVAALIILILAGMLLFGAVTFRQPAR